MSQNIKDKNEKEGEVERKQKDIASEYAAKKLEKITGALYLITSHFPLNEPLRASIRTKALSLLSGSHAIQASIGLRGEQFSYNISTHLGELISLLLVAANTGLLSRQNFDVLRHECSTLARAVGDMHGVVGEPLLEEDYFSSPAALPVLDYMHKTENERLLYSNNREREDRSRGGNRGRKIRGTEGESRESRVVNRRKKSILEVLKNKGKVGINEIEREVRGCSRKTIQRELLSLAEEGIVGVEGKRRWTRYVLKRG